MFISFILFSYAREGENGILIEYILNKQRYALEDDDCVFRNITIMLWYHIFRLSYTHTHTHTYIYIDRQYFVGFNVYHIILYYIQYSVLCELTLLLDYFFYKISGIMFRTFDIFRNKTFHPPPYLPSAVLLFIEECMYIRI